MGIGPLSAYYDQAFKKKLESTSDPVVCSPSLLEWTKSNASLWQKNAPMSAIELGCGPRSILEELPLPQTSQRIGVDFSRTMTDYARLSSRSKVTYECFDVLELETHPLLKSLDFDLAIDGHLFHCLTEASARKKYLASVLHKLEARRGYFVLECMVETDSLSFADDFLFLQDTRVLLQQIGWEAVPVRYIPRVENVLEEFKKSGFKIVKFLCPLGTKIISDARREEPIDGDPGLARLLLIT